MASYNIYVSDRKDTELVEVFNNMKKKGTLSEFIVESCQANLPLFLDRKVAENEAQAKYFEELKKSYNCAKESVIKKINDEKQEYLESLPNDRTQEELLSWLTSSVNITEWKAVGFKTAFEVARALKMLKEESNAKENR